MDAAENRAVEIERLVDQMNLQLSLLSSSHKKASEDVAGLKVNKWRKEARRCCSPTAGGSSLEPRASDGVRLAAAVVLGTCTPFVGRTQNASTMEGAETRQANYQRDSRRVFCSPNCHEFDRVGGAARKSSGSAKRTTKPFEGSTPLRK